MLKAPVMSAGIQLAKRWSSNAGAALPARPNALRAYFEQHQEGPGIWKFQHYFDIYERHLGKFVGTDVRLLEIGIYSGGSLDMWRTYLGEQSHIIGVDIQESCRAYAGPQKTIYIGDQSDREFWRTVRDENPIVDVVIDDGGHDPWQQQVSLEELLPHLRPGGVYICEDVPGSFNRFAGFVEGLTDALMAVGDSLATPPGGGLRYSTTAFQKAVRSITFYPFAIVIERNETDMTELFAEKKGTVWEPFLNHIG